VFEEQLIKLQGTTAWDSLQ